MKKSSLLFFVFLCSKLFCSFSFLMDSIYASTYKFSNPNDYQTVEKWKNILDLAHEKLLQENDDEKIQAQIHLLLADCYFYLKQFDNVEKHILDSIKLSYNTDLDTQLRSLNLLACYYRSKVALTEKYCEKIVFFHKGLSTIYRALAYAKHSSNNLLQAEIFFNAGMYFTHDFSNQMQKGLDYFVQAMQVFQDEGLIDYYLETKIHLTKAYLLEGEFTQAKRLVKEIHEEISRKEKNSCSAVIENLLTQSLGCANDAIFLLMEMFTHIHEFGIEKNFEEIQKKTQLLES